MPADAFPEREAWDRVAAGWRTWWETIERPAHAVTQRLLDLARVARGHVVLDIGTGLGEPALSAARRVGSTGRAVATDLSPKMLAMARERATRAELSNLEFVEGDAAQLDFAAGSFDAVLCRWGITSLPAPLATMRSIRRLLRTDGSFATAVWESGPKGRPLATLANALADELLDGIETGVPVFERTESVERSLPDEMRRAGFTEVEAERMTIVLTWRSTGDCLQYLSDVSPELGARLAAHSTARRAEYRAQLEARLSPYLSTDGRVVIPNETICAVGRG